MKPLSEQALKEAVLTILRYPNGKRPPRNSIAEEIRHEQAEKLVKLILQDRKAWGEQVQKNMADNLINQERTLYKIFDDDISICVGIKRMADEVREYYDGGIYQKN